MSGPRTIGVVGLSLAGLRAAETLRREGFDGRLFCVGEEPHLPYDRPPLSKEILRGDWEAERTALRRKGLDGLGLDLRLGRRAVALDPAARSLTLDDGERLVYDGLIIATGSRARRLPGLPDLDGIHLLRTLDDALRIRHALEASPRVVIIGAGFIGAEVAASCRARGLEVTMIEPLPVPMQRGLGDEMGEVCAKIHRDEGVDLRCGVGLSSLEGDGRVEAVKLADGTRVDANLVIIGVGAEPVTDWLTSSGLALSDGVVCDATCATGAPGVVAAGDVARWHNPRFGIQMRLEHWTNAAEQGMAAAVRVLRGADEAQPYAPVPLFWSDQYDVKIQFAGVMQPGDRMQLIEGSVDSRRFTALFERAGRLVGVLTFNRARDCMRYRGLIEAGVSFEEALAQAEAAR